MAHVQAWRSFRRMQRSTCAAGGLIYAGAAVHAWRVLPGPTSLKASLILVFPAVFALLAFVAPLQIRPVRRVLKRYVWMSFAAGFGQTPVSVISGLGLLVFAAVFIYLQIGGVASGGRYPAGCSRAMARASASCSPRRCWPPPWSGNRRYARSSRHD